jgi:hypothetical protein
MVLVRYRLFGQRLRAVEVVVKAGVAFEETPFGVWGHNPPIDVATWRSIPIADLETRANLPENYKVIMDYVDDGEGALNIAGVFEETVVPPSPRRTRRALRLPKVSGRRYPDEFYRRVADAYRAAIDFGESPGRAVAEMNQVPVTTTRRWFAEARRRGFLDPAQSMGRAG